MTPRPVVLTKDHDNPPVHDPGNKALRTSVADRLCRGRHRRRTGAAVPHYFVGCDVGRQDGRLGRRGSHRKQAPRRESADQHLLTDELRFDSSGDKERRQIIGNEMKRNRWVLWLDTFYVLCLTCGAVANGLLAHHGGFAVVAYFLAVLVVIPAVLVAVAGRRFGIESVERAAAITLLDYTFVFYFFVYVVHDLMTGRSAMLDEVFLLVWLLLIGFDGRRGGRRHLRRLIGEKSRALLAKLQTPTPVRATR